MHCWELGLWGDVDVTVRHSSFFRACGRAGSAGFGSLGERERGGMCGVREG